jgi:HAD superfamily hydrolase (TIGR01509 family)
LDNAASDDRYRRRRLDDFGKILAAAGLDVSRSALDHGYEASGVSLGRVWSDNRDVPVERHVAMILAAADPELPRRVTALVTAELVDAYARAALLVPPAVDPSARGALETLAARGYALVVVSNTMRTPGATLRKLLERYGLLGFFKHTTFSDEVGIRKPAAEIFALALRAVGGDAATAVHVGDDARLDVDGARAAGMRVIQVRSTPGRPPVGQTPDAVITSLRDLPAAIDRVGSR